MILVTGATGNVGREVVRLLMAGGEQVEAVTVSRSERLLHAILRLLRCLLAH